MTEHLYDKSTWSAGPWQEEPDRLEWRSQGLPCLMVRNQFGTWCGYIGVAPTHPWHGKGYTSCVRVPPCGEEYCDHTVEMLVSIHGGLTYADACRGHICHTPHAGESEDVWWFGFDCSHAGDYSPAINARLPAHLKDRCAGLDDRPPFPEETYKTLRYAKDATEQLARQCVSLRKESV